MSNATLANTCNASTLAEQTSNKPNYTPGKALKKAFKQLKRIFKSTTGSKGNNNNTATKPQAATEQQHQQEAEAFTLDVSTLTTCSTLSAEEYENELNEFAELAAANKFIAAK